MEADVRFLDIRYGPGHWRRRRDSDTAVPPSFDGLLQKEACVVDAALAAGIHLRHAALGLLERPDALLPLRFLFLMFAIVLMH